MPVMEGLSAARAVRELQAGSRRVPIIAVTANAMTDDRESCLQAGMDDFLSKPVLLEELAVALVCASRRMAAARV